MAKLGTGIDCGTSSVTAVTGRMKGSTLQLHRAFRHHFSPDERTGDLPEDLENFEEGLASSGITAKDAVLGITGRDVMLRYTKAPAMSLYQLKNLMAFEVEEIAEKAGGDVASDYSILRGDEDDSGEATILVGLAKNRFLVPRLTSMTAAGVSARFSCPIPLALYTAFLQNGDFRRGETTLLLDIGFENLDMAIQSDGELLFARSMNLGGKTFSEAIMGMFSSSYGKAEGLKLEKADVSARSGGSHDPTAEKISNAMAGVCGQLLSAIQSSILFCKNQSAGIDVKLDRIILSGGGGALNGLPEYLQANLEVPVALFEFVAAIDDSHLPDDERDAFQEKPHEFAAAVGLLNMRLSDSSFRLEIVPDDVRKKRSLVEKTSKLAAAGLIAVVFLGAKALVGSANLEDTEKRYSKLKTDESKRTSNAEKFEELVTDVETLNKKLDVLADLTTPGSAMSLAYDLVQDHLPEDLWVQNIEVRFAEIELAKGEGQDEEEEDRRSSSRRRGRGRDRNAKATESEKTMIRLPLVHISGQGRESVDDVQKIVNGFAQKLRSDPRISNSSMKYNNKARTFEIEVDFFSKDHLPESESKDMSESEDEGATN